MSLNCTAYNCFNRSDKGYALVRYPCNEIIKQKWIAAIGRGKNWSPSASQKLCEVHFKPSKIEFVAGRKRVKSDSVPSRFCTSEDQENYLKNRNNLTSGSSKYITNMIKDHCDHTYSTSDQRKPLRELSVDNMSNGKTCPRNKWRTVVQHQYGCVQACKPLTIEDIKTTVKFQDIEEQLDTLQPMVENNDVLRSIVHENEQLCNEIKGTVENIVNIKKKTENTDVEINKSYEENYELKQQVKVLSEQLSQKILVDDQWKAIKSGQSRGLK